MRDENQQTKKKSPINPLKSSRAKIAGKFNQVNEDTMNEKTAMENYWSYKSETEEDNPLIKYYRESR
jgi:hypothetical protein